MDLRTTRLPGARRAEPVLNPVFSWLLGGPGAFLALPMTLFVAVMLDTFPETRWLANIVGISSPDAETERPP
jgi:hypothetical protein